VGHAFFFCENEISMHQFRPFLRILTATLVLLLAWNLRLQAATYLPVDYDEDDYLRAAQEYAAVIRSGDFSGFLDHNYRPEHPPLLKILYGWAIADDPEVPLIPDRPTTAAPDATLPRPHLIHARTLGAVLGTLLVAALAVLNPLAGFLLAIHTFTIKYTSQVMLESLPALTSFLMVLAYRQAVPRDGGFSRHKTAWLALSGAFLGLTAASKYVYAIVGIAVLLDWYWLSLRENAGSEPVSKTWRTVLRRYAPRKDMLFWGLLSIAVFFAANPYLWSDSLNRLSESVFYHAGYSSGAVEVQRAGYPFFQSIVHMFFSPYWWGQNRVFVFPFDPFIAALALLGLKRLWQKDRVYALWFLMALAFLFVWRTKWAQYNLIFSVPLALSAAQGAKAFLLEPLQTWWVGLRAGKAAPEPQRNDWRRAWPWLVPGLLAFAALTIFPLLFQIGVSLTDFSQSSLRDGLQGGLWRAIFGGLSGQIPATLPTEFPYRASQVHYIGPVNFIPALGYLTNPETRVLVFNMLWMFLSVVLQTALGLGLALLLWQRGVRLSKFWQALFIIPWAIPEMIGALMWFNIFQPEAGWLALAVKQYGPNIPFGFLNDWENSTNLWLLVFLIPALWYGFPFMFMAASAGLKMIPNEVFDAAAIDGANPWQVFAGVTWPLLLPLLLPAVIVRGIFAFNQFYLFQAFFFFDATLATLSYNIFASSGYSFLGGQFAIASVINVIAMLMLVIFALLFNRWSKAGQGVTYA
jgi:arabinogalactan oligomer/maltooligosaccharide transport system permease protein